MFPALDEDFQSTTDHPRAVAVTEKLVALFADAGDHMWRRQFSELFLRTCAVERCQISRCLHRHRCRHPSTSLPRSVRWARPMLRLAHLNINPSATKCSLFAGSMDQNPSSFATRRANSTAMDLLVFESIIAASTSMNNASSIAGCLGPS